MNFAANFTDRVTPEAVKRSPYAAANILHFWFVESDLRDWFAGGLLFDTEIRNRFTAHYEAAAAGMLNHWSTTVNGSLALLILLDQFPRNMFRRDPRAFATDGMARQIARTAIARRFDMITPEQRRSFFYMPFMHSEYLPDQRLCVALFKTRLASSVNLPFAIEHMEIIERFGRFPHRNAVLDRTSNDEERRYLAQGGFSA